MHYERILITGIHTGLGNALTRAFLTTKAHLYGISRKMPADIEGDERLHFASIDLSRLEEIRDRLRDFLVDVDGLDLVILNAGILGEFQTMRDASLREIATVMDINVWANKVLYDTILDMQIDVKQLIAISSGASVNGSGGMGVYSISKAAVNLLFRGYANENPQTHFTSLAPGLIDTQMLGLVSQRPDDERFPVIERIKSATGTERLQSPAQAAKRIIEVLPNLLEHPSGAYVDIREM
jgi:benzil reductase ((S)-benzoin forming)